MFKWMAGSWLTSGLRNCFIGVIGANSTITTIAVITLTLHIHNQKKRCGILRDRSVKSLIMSIVALMRLICKPRRNPLRLASEAVADVIWGYRGGSPTAVRPREPALCGSCPLVTPYYCRLGDLLCFMCVYRFVLHYCLCMCV